MIYNAKKGVSMSGQDLFKLRVIQDYIDKRLSRSEAAEKLNMSIKQVTRLKNKVIFSGPEKIIHGLKGKHSNNQTPYDLKKKIFKIYEDKYLDCGFNFTHLAEKFLEIENIEISRETLRQWIRPRYFSSRLIKKSRKYRARRERRSSFGELLQLDTSPHDWLSTGEKLQLIVIVDDATSSLVCARLFKHDGTLSNLAVLGYVFRKFGLPKSIYTDKASWFHYCHQGRESKKQVIDTQIGRALKMLGVELIAAHSPQAKGRVERMNGVLQDRLIPEFKLNNISTIESANHFLENEFIQNQNGKFSINPRSTTSVFMPLVNPNILDEILCIEFENQVLNDNTISRANKYHIQLFPSETRVSWVKAKVILRIKVDGSVLVRHAQSKEIIPSRVIFLKIAHENKHSDIRTRSEMGLINFA